MTALVTGNKMHSFEERGADLYETPPEATLALLRCESLPHHIWEPACGRGAISKILTAAGHRVQSTDLYDYGFGTPGFDFLEVKQSRVDVEAVVTNPPYKHATEFVEHALHHAPLVAMLLRLNFLESVKRNSILDGGKLARVHVFRNRLPMMHRDGWDGPRATSAIAFAWFVWDRWFQGNAATIDRISWLPIPANDNKKQEERISA